MGYIRHKALIVTGAGYPEANKAVKSCRRHIIRKLKLQEDLVLEYSDLSNLVTPIRRGVNSVTSFAVLPDGSKEGWPPSDCMDEAIADLIIKIESYHYDDGSSPIGYGYMQFEDDERVIWLKTRRGIIEGEGKSGEGAD